MAESVTKYETQRERWVKYGANVGLSVVVAGLLVALIVFLAQKKDHRFDTTAEGNYSLKPQTINIINNLKSPITIVSLYSKQSNREDHDVYSQAVEDLLNEYKREGKKIDVQFIDPLSQPAKEDALITEVTSKYGGEVKAYKDFLDDYSKQYKQIRDATAAESKSIEAVPMDQVNSSDQDLARTLLSIINTAEGFPPFLDDKEDSIERRLKQKPPDYKGAVDSVQSAMEGLSQQLDAIDQLIAKSKDNPATPAPVKKYLEECGPRFAAIKKQSDAIDDKAKKLGDLKLDTLRTSLREKDSILVMGENDLRVLNFDQVWRTEDTLRQYARGGKVKPTFAGEQLITTAIYGLTQPTRQKVVIVRPGGAPLCDPGIPGFTPGGPLSQAADRLRQYNFDVMEKDLSGQYAMQAQMQGQQAGPEPTDAEMKDAIWVVIAAPFNNRSQMGETPPTLGPKLEQHLNEGGSAFVLPFPQDDSATSVLAAVGIDLRTDAVAVHDTPPPAANSTGDPADDLQHYPFVFNIRNYGDSPITLPLRSLDSLLVPLLPVKTHAVKGYDVENLLPIPDAPNAPRSWGETDLADLQKNDPPTFDPKTDIAGPLFAGATSEKIGDGKAGDSKAGDGRVVVIASPYFIFNTTLNEVDPDLARKGMFVPRFPGNLELFANSIFWLAHQESMIAISPSAMQVSRIADMSDATLNSWRVGLLLLGLPGLVIVAGCLVFVARRD